MRLTFERFDGRQRISIPVIDEDTGQEVGYIRTEGSGPASFGGIWVSLFGGKYSITVHKYEECWGFVNGVEAVLRHVLWHLVDIRYPPEERGGGIRVA